MALLLLLGWTGASRFQCARACAYCRLAREATQPRMPRSTFFPSVPGLPVHAVLTACWLVLRYKIPVMDFDTFMANVKATGAQPYLVLNYDSANLINGSGDWSYNQLLDLAKSWIAYIIKMGYKVRVCRDADSSPNGCLRQGLACDSRPDHDEAANHAAAQTAAHLQILDSML